MVEQGKMSEPISKHDERIEKDEEKKIGQEPSSSSGASREREQVMGSNQNRATPTKPKRTSFFGKIDIDFITIVLMAKGALPPVIMLALYQSDYFAAQLGVSGYLGAIISIFALAFAPRARFLQNLFLGTIAISIGIAGGALTTYSAVQARRHTTPPRPPSASPPSTPGVTPTQQAVPYNAAASTVSAIFLFFWIYVTNVIKEKMPQAMVGVIFMSIITIVSCMNAPLFPTVSYAMSFIQQLLKSAYLGLAIAAGVSLFIIPISTRKAAKMGIAGVLIALKQCLITYRALLTSFEDHDAMADMLVADRAPSPETQAARASLKAAALSNSNLQVNLPFAKREIGYGKIGPPELKSLNDLLRKILLPTLGLESVTGLFQHFASIRGWTEESIAKMGEEELAEREKGVVDWTNNMKLVHKSFDGIISIMEDAIDHVLIQLQFKKRPKGGASTEKQLDVEDNAEATAPGDPGFAEYLDRKSNKFYYEKHFALLEWGRNHGITWPDNFFENPETASLQMTESMRNDGGVRRSQNQRQLYLLLYLEFLLWRMSRSFLDLVLYADGLVASGHMSKNKIILPSFKRLRKAFTSVFTNRDISKGSGMEDIDSSDVQVCLGTSYGRQRDPEHLPPTNFIEKIGDYIRLIPKFLRSPASIFGFRVAVASISLALMMFLRQTQRFGNEYRLFWAVIMVAIGMSPTAGQSFSGFILRILGTAISMLCAWIIYYAGGNGNIAGILVLYWFFTALGLYVPIKMPQFRAAGLIAIVTTTLIIGYELEARKIGRTAIANSGQTYLGILVFGPARLATVVAGLTVGFIFTIFPYPISEHSVLRRDLGGALYMLANYYSIVHETTTGRVKGNLGDPDVKGSPARRMEKIRLKVYVKQQLLLDNLKQYSNFIKWEIPIGGKFPKQDYDVIITAVENLSFMYLDSSGKVSKWTADFRRIMTSIRPTSQESVMLLSLLAAAMKDGRPLPPYLPHPRAYELTRRMEEIDSDILSVRHVNEPGYAAFAVLQLASRCIGHDIDILVDKMKKVLGEVDFSFRVTHLNSSGSSSEVGDEKRD